MQIKVTIFGNSWITILHVTYLQKRWGKFHKELWQDHMMHNNSIHHKTLCTLWYILQPYIMCCFNSDVYKPEKSKEASLSHHVWSSPMEEIYRAFAFCRYQIREALINAVIIIFYPWSPPCVTINMEAFPIDAHWRHLEVIIFPF